MLRLATLTTSRPRLFIAVFAVLTALAAVGIPRVGINATVAAMYPDESAHSATQTLVEETFGAGQLLIVMLEGDVYTPAAMEALRGLTSELSKVTGVKRVTSATNAQRMEDDDGFLLITDLLPASGSITPEQVSAARAYLETARMYQGGVLVAEDGGSTNVVVEVDPNGDSDRVVAAARRAVAAHWTEPSLGSAYFVGSPVVNTAMRGTLEREMPLLGAIAALLLLVMLYLNFRSLRGALLPVLTVSVGMVWAFGVLGWLGGSFTTMTSIAPVAILAVGSSFSLHLLGRYSVELAHGAQKMAAIRTAVTETGLGVLISGMAISAAMLTFTLSGMPAVRALGMLVAGGVLASLLASLLLLPAVLSLLKPPKRVTDPEAPGAIGGLLKRLGVLVDRRRNLILLVSLVLAVLAVVGVLRIEANTAVLDYFRTDSPIRQDYERVEQAFGGSSQVQLVVTGDLGDPEAIRAMARFQERAAELPGAGPTSSIATVIAAIHETLTGEYGLPATREALAQELLIYQLSGDVQHVSQFMTLDSSMGLIEMSIKTGSTREQRAMVERIDALARAEFTGLLEHSFAGATPLQIDIEDSLMHDFLISLSLAVVLVIIIDSLVRSLAAALVTIVVLLLTILFQYGLLGFLGVPLDLATMLLGALAIGVGDYAIHLTVRYMEQRRAGDPPEVAMGRAILTSGRSILFTALTLGAGFGALIASEFVPIRTLGSLMAFTVLSVGLISLTVLPAACLVFLRQPRGSSNLATNPATAKEAASNV